MDKLSFSVHLCGGAAGLRIFCCDKFGDITIARVTIELGSKNLVGSVHYLCDTGPGEIEGGYVTFFFSRRGWGHVTFLSQRGGDIIFITLLVLSPGSLEIAIFVSQNV